MGAEYTTTIGAGSREQGWDSGASSRLITATWPGFETRGRHHLWVEFSVGSRPLRVFLHNNSKFKFHLVAEGVKATL